MSLLFIELSAFYNADQEMLFSHKVLKFNLLAHAWRLFLNERDETFFYKDTYQQRGRGSRVAGNCVQTTEAPQLLYKIASSVEPDTNGREFESRHV